MSSIFTSRSPAPKSADQKKISSLAKRISKAERERMKSGPVNVIVKRPESK